MANAGQSPAAVKEEEEESKITIAASDNDEVKAGVIAEDVKSSPSDRAPVNGHRTHPATTAQWSSSIAAHPSSDDVPSSSSKPTPIREGPSSPSSDQIQSSSENSFSPKDLDLELSPSSPSASTSRKHSPSYGLTQVATSLAPKRKKKASTVVSHPPQIIDHLPRADEEALASFVRLDENWYANRHIGRSKGHEQGLVCECNYRPGRDDVSSACTDEAGCINRLTQVECVSKDCRCAEFCQNQRFQRKQYADVEIIKTEQKGFGLRAARSIPAESFVYEYIGEVVEPDDFHKRMRRYHDERIPHFYFMMLQKDEYLDATKKGGVARFINHSCNPNCYVAKWHVGKHMRMGIFAQRDILSGEELTFNYNVDRYGNDAQPCYCGEPNCVGQLGGKTQTDIGGMSNLYIEALGIVDEVERLQARGSRKQKSRILDEDFKPTLHPLEEDETSTVATAIRQAANNRAILTKLLERIEMTDDVAVHKRFVRLHGFVLMAGVMTEWQEDRDVIISSMKILSKWPLIARNKVVDTGIEAIVEAFRKNQDADIASLASELFDAWQQLSLEFRIARKEDDGGSGDRDHGEEDDAQMRSRRRRDEEDDSRRIQARMDEALDAAQAPNDVSRALEQVVPRPLGTFNGVPTGPNARRNGGAPSFEGTPNRFNRSGPGAGAGWRGAMNARFPSGPTTPQTPDVDARFIPGAGPGPTARSMTTSTMSIEEIIRRANESQAAEAARMQREEANASVGARSPSPTKPHGENPSVKRKSSSKVSSNRDREKKHKSSSSNGASGEDKQRKRLSGLVGEIVVRAMSKKKDEPPLSDKDAFKRHAREATEVLVTKEWKRLKATSSSSSSSSSVTVQVPDKIATEKKDKIKVFVEEYADKLIARHKSKAQAAAAATTTADGGSASTSGNGNPQASV